ncbi:HNH endonuclease signature motif containing protein [Rosenbergiella collisarenosi]|uniref:HNH endonuclease signature motif containing protein n=1 Tax=Rosenbergiella collisarenosi TaxID=1544695 RepID=UPI001F4D7692|nr:HNH endonuclease signature motif containing protein [Rosenbergiella collisarenosi]
MPWKPLSRCTEPGCNKRVTSGKCEEHQRVYWRAEDKRRGNRRERGYTNAWDKYRLQYLKAHPLCVECQQQGLLIPAKIVDHIIPISGGDDVLFWPEWNHQPLCQTHHNQKTVKQDPITKARREAGELRELESKAVRGVVFYE